MHVFYCFVFAAFGDVVPKHDKCSSLSPCSRMCAQRSGGAPTEMMDEGKVGGPFIE